MEPALPSTGATLVYFLLVTVLPSALALMSPKVSGGAKLVWFLLSLFLSWLGFLAFYFLVANKSGSESS